MPFVTSRINHWLLTVIYSCIIAKPLTFRVKAGISRVSFRPSVHLTAPPIPSHFSIKVG